MKIAIYGISRCGKDYLIQQLLLRLSNKLLHFKGSETLRRLAFEKYNKPFIELDSDQQLKLRKSLVDVVLLKEKEHENIVVDGHYAFPKTDQGFDVVFTEADRSLYDVFIYVRKSAQLVKSNSDSSDRVQWKYYLSDCSRIEEWQRFEIEQLRDECAKISKPFILVDDDTSCTLNFIAELINNSSVVHPHLVARRLFDELKNELIDAKDVVITDCDKTLSIEDPTMFLIEGSQYDKTKIKDIFKGDTYSIYQFYRLHHYLDKIDKYQENCSRIAKTTVPFRPLIDQLHSHRKEATTIAITTGVGEIWAQMNRHYQFADVVIGHSPHQVAGLINSFVSAEIKSELVRLIQSAGKRVIAFGDSLVDWEMLNQANRGIIVCTSKLNQSLMKCIDNVNISMYQPDFNVEFYSQCKKVTDLWSL